MLKNSKKTAFEQSRVTLSLKRERLPVKRQKKHNSTAKQKKPLPRPCTTAHDHGNGTDDVSNFANHVKKFHELAYCPGNDNHIILCYEAPRIRTSCGISKRNFIVDQQSRECGPRARKRKRWCNCHTRQDFRRRRNGTPAGWDPRGPGNFFLKEKV